MNKLIGIIFLICIVCVGCSDDTPDIKKYISDEYKSRVATAEYLLRLDEQIAGQDARYTELESWIKDKGLWKGGYVFK